MMIRTLFITVFLAAVTGCASLQPVKDNDQRVTLLSPDAKQAGSLYPAPISSVDIPNYLNEGTVWYSDSDGKLLQIDGYIWAEPMSKALRRELSLSLGQKNQPPDGLRFDLKFPSFILLSDGSGRAIVEASVSRSGNTQSLPVIFVSEEAIWVPAQPESFLEGYRTLLETTARRLSSALALSASKMDGNQ